MTFGHIYQGGAACLLGSDEAGIQSHVTRMERQIFLMTSHTQRRNEGTQQDLSCGWC